MNPAQNDLLKLTSKTRAWAILYTVGWMLVIFGAYFACGLYGL